jgi:hypothetical protein
VGRNKKKRPFRSGRFACLLGGVITDLPVIVVVIVPVALATPAVAFHIPPTMAVFPAVLAGFTEFGTTVRGLLALVSVVLNGFVQFVVGPNQSLLAIIGHGAGCAGEKHKSASQHGGSDNGFPVSQNARMSHDFSLLRNLALRLATG